ncbi:hypothetical protein BJ912DRAFT_353356 [Pholiota molesta]|nr:hypothetical protein BJ912DRAFT_353356 [Pholiota molesta]
MQQYGPPSYPPPSFFQANAEAYTPHHYTQTAATSSLPQHPAYYNPHATSVPAHATSYSLNPYPALPSTVRNYSDPRVESSVIPSASTQEYQTAPAVYRDPCVVATSSQAPFNDHSREYQSSTASAQPQGHSLNTSNNVNIANSAQPLVYGHSSLPRSQTFSDDRPFMPRMRASTTQLQAAPTLTFDDEHVPPPLNSYGQISRSASVETSLYPTPPPAYQELIYTPTPPIPLSQPLWSSSSTPSSHPIAQPLYREQNVALSLRQQQPPNGLSFSAVHAPSPLHRSCSAGSEPGPPTTEKSIKIRQKTQSSKSSKRKVAQTKAKKTKASTTAVDAANSSTSTARGVNGRDAEVVANSSTVTQSERYSTPPSAAEGSSTATKTTNKRRREYLNDTSASTTATKKRCLANMGSLIKGFRCIDARWLSPKAEKKLYSSSPSYLCPLDRNCCDAPLINILKPECDTIITFGVKTETLMVTRAVSLSSCLDGDALLDSPREVIVRKPNWPPVFTLNIVWFGYQNISYMLRVPLNKGRRAMTKAHLAAIIARVQRHNQRAFRRRMQAAFSVPSSHIEAWKGWCRV